MTAPRSDTASGQPTEWVMVPREPGSCELDDSGWLLAFVVELHNGVSPESRPQGWSDFSDEQRERIKRAYRAMLAAAPPPPAEGWRPIESAPKDGTKILAWAADYEIWVTWFADFGRGPKWFDWEPTHWMPLPAPPEEPKP